MPKLRLRAKLRNWTGFQKREDQLAIILSLVIVVIVGLTVVAFILLTGRLAARMYPPGSAAWRRVLIPTAGSLVSGLLLFRYFPNARGSGIPQAKFALFIQDGFISLRTVAGKFLCCSISLASGIALGREGPSVQIGAGIASVLARRFGLSIPKVKALLPVGCSAALAAAFNTPIAAVLFRWKKFWAISKRRCSEQWCSVPRRPGSYCISFSATSRYSMFRPTS
jgi:chloride channel protein, CIC family